MATRKIVGRTMRDHMRTEPPLAALMMAAHRQSHDNAPMKSFFHTLKVELVHRCRWATQAGARQALSGYIEDYDDRHRIHSALGC